MLLLAMTADAQFNSETHSKIGRREIDNAIALTQGAGVKRGAGSRKRHTREEVKADPFLDCPSCSRSPNEIAFYCNACHPV